MIRYKVYYFVSYAELIILNFRYINFYYQSILLNTIKKATNFFFKNSYTIKHKSNYYFAINVSFC